MTDTLPAALKLLACPACWNALTLESRPGSESAVVCDGCGKRYPLVDGIPVLIPSQAV